MGKPWENGGLMGFDEIYFLVNLDKTIENHHLPWGNSQTMAMFNDYVSLPEGNLTLRKVCVDCSLHLRFRCFKRSQTDWLWQPCILVAMALPKTCLSRGIGP